MLTTILFTHDDMDGAGCAIIFNLLMKAQGVNYEIVHCSNTNIDKKIQDVLGRGIIDGNTQICFGDICPSEEMARTLQEKFGGNIRVWDHHKTNSYISNAIPGSKIISEIEPGRLECGTTLMYLFFSRVPSWDDDNYNMDLLEALTENIRSYDTYEFKKTGNKTAQRLNALCKILGIKRFVDRYTERIMQFTPVDGDDLIEDRDNEYIDAYLEKEQDAIDSLTMDDIKVAMIKGYKVAIKFADGAKINEMADQFLRKNPDFDAFIELGIGNGYFSFRTAKEDLNVGEVFAIPLGGGGHPRAAGCPISETIKNEIYDIFIKNLSEGS